ncbi:MAG: glycosyltransferase [Clostridiales bacterium]|nr:glycosyltransferase [Clostridiales bacterium]
MANTSISYKRVSIIIPVYNCHSVAKAIESIPNDRAIEIIVIDGGSDKKTREIIESHCNRIDYYVSEKDQGLYDAMNKGVRVAKGEWVFTLAADDQLLCNPVHLIDRYCNDESDIICGKLIALDFQGRFFILEPNSSYHKLLVECTINHPGCFFRRSVYDRFGFYDLRYKCAADHEFFIRLWKHNAKFKFIPEIITYFSYGGLSTKNHFFAFREDVLISDQYNVSRLISRSNYILRTLKFYGSKVKDRLHIPHKTYYMTANQLMDVLRYHPEVINRAFLEKLEKKGTIVGNIDV